ncbi:MAG: DUF2336 domain-containing protein [Alphaproteobacteria bacterium]
MSGLLNRIRTALPGALFDRVPGYEEQKRLAAHDDPEIRRKLAARPDVRPEVLYFLASDETPEVRREIAKNEQTPEHAHTILARDADDDVRVALAATVSRLLPDLEDRERERVRERAIETLTTLAEDQLKRVRQVLADALKDRLDAPPAVIQRLARDSEIDVASPVLRCSPLLSDADLLDIIRTSASPGVLRAISKRKTVGASVSDAIVEGNDVKAVAALLSNPSAQIREETLDRLIDRAPGVVEWHEPLVGRPALPQKALSRIAGFVAASLLEALKRRGDLDSSTLEAVGAEMRRRLESEDKPKGAHGAAPHPVKAAPSASAELERARTLHKKGQLDEEAISAALLAQQRQFVIAALSIKAKLGEPIVEKILASRTGPGITALAWKSGLSVDTAVQLQLHLGKIAPNAVLMPRGEDRYPMTAEDMTWQIEFYSTLVPAAR